MAAMNNAAPTPRAPGGGREARAQWELPSVGRLEVADMIQSSGFETCFYHLPAVRLGEANLTSLASVPPLLSRDDSNTYITGVL